jgi:hypothetical protein
LDFTIDLLKDLAVLGAFSIGYALEAGIGGLAGSRPLRLLFRTLRMHFLL